MTDPFASAPDEPQTAPEGIATAITSVIDNVTNGLTAVPAPSGEVVVTLKGGSGFEAPWIVVHAPNAQSALSQLDDTMLTLMEKAQNAAKHFSGLAPAKASPNQGIINPSAVPAGATSAPIGAPPAPGPDWIFKSGVSASTGKPWKGWMPPRGSTDKPLFFN